MEIEPTKNEHSPARTGNDESVPSEQRVEPASCYWKVAGLIPLVCMSKCPWARYWTPNCSWSMVGSLHGSHHHQCMNYCKSLWTKHSAVKIRRIRNGVGAACDCVLKNSLVIFASCVSKRRWERQVDTPAGCWQEINASRRSSHKSIVSFKLHCCRRSTWSTPWINKVVAEISSMCD